MSKLAWSGKPTGCRTLAKAFSISTASVLFASWRHPHMARLEDLSTRGWYQSLQLLHALQLLASKGWLMLGERNTDHGMSLARRLDAALLAHAASGMRVNRTSESLLSRTASRRWPGRWIAACPSRVDVASVERGYDAAEDAFSQTWLRPRAELSRLAPSVPRMPWPPRLSKLPHV